MASSDTPSQPPAINYVVGFLLVGIAWGLTTPFIRRAARDHNPPAHPLLARDDVKASWLKSKLYGAFFAVVDLLRNPRYAVPLLINLTGSVWFFLLIGQAGKVFCNGVLRLPVAYLLCLELSLTVPIVNTLAFLFTVLGDWWVDRKVISRNTWIGMALSLCGIGLCVQSKSG
ncbi:Uu.00g101670.m01.CDS01 [Anthostomella pinea]|uniref:Uu.00g101670.m01.CDS01 n=1 Tax=Anthostomella pinea TaxID=933095 RepID=A0AAI8YFF9_9PEZI|nr:Uu.00g101670.m01.CDS01 [Anthostomella pinea]